MWAHHDCNANDDYNADQFTTSCRRAMRPACLPFYAPQILPRFLRVVRPVWRRNRAGSRGVQENFCVMSKSGVLHLASYAAFCGHCTACGSPCIWIMAKPDWVALCSAPSPHPRASQRLGKLASSLHPSPERSLYHRAQNIRRVPPTTQLSSVAVNTAEFCVA